MYSSCETNAETLPNSELSTFSSGSIDSLPNSVGSYSPYNYMSYVYPTSTELAFPITGYETGIVGEERTGIGAFYFEDYTPPSIYEAANYSMVTCAPTVPANITFWDILLNFWTALESGRDVWEKFWTCIVDVGFDMANKAEYYYNATRPETSDICVYEYNLDIDAQILKAIPLPIDATRPSESHFIRVELVSHDYESIRTRIRIPSHNFDSIRNVSVGLFLVSGDLYGTIVDMINNEIVVDGIIDIKDQVYVTPGRQFRVNESVIDVPALTKSTFEEDIVYLNGRDYTYKSGVLEILNKDMIGYTVYCRNAPLINEDLILRYGDVTGWKGFNYDNLTARAAIGALLGALQESDNKVSYQRALGIYYGLPVAPSSGRVVGLYESYGYEITSITSNIVKLKIKSDLHAFIQPGTRMISDSGVTYEVNAVHDRALGTILTSSSTGLKVGDKLYTKLENSYSISSFQDQSIHVHMGLEGIAKISHLPYIMNKMYGGKRWTEAIVMSDSESNIVEFTGVSGPSSITVKGVIPSGAHTIRFMWPTHKFLCISLDDFSRRSHKIYLDSTVDTWLNTGDRVEKYDRITSNISTDHFKRWTDYTCFRRENPIHEMSDIVETVRPIQGAIAGEYFPSDIK